MPVMGFWSRLMGYVELTARYWRGGDDHSRSRRRHDAGAAVMSGMVGGAYGQSYPGGWTSDRVEQVLHYKHWTFVAVRAICHEIAAQTPRVAMVYDRLPAATKEYHGRRVKSLGSVGEHEVIDEVGPQHPLCRLFCAPNAWDVPGDLWYELILFLELTGNAYLWCPLNRAGLPAQLWVIPSHWVWRKLGAAGVRYYEVRPLLGGGTFFLPPEEMIELRYKNPAHKIDGWAPQQAGAEWIDASQSVDSSRFYQFKNGCFPIGAVELGEQYADPDDTQLEQIYAKFFARLQGEHNYGRPVVTPPGAKYVPLTINPVEMAYVESAEQLRDWVLALYGVPKEVAGIQDAGSEIAMYGPMLQFAKYCIAPKLRYLGQALTRHLARRYDECLRVWWEYEMPRSPQQANADDDLMMRYGLKMPNEIRAERGLRPYTREEEDRYADPGTTSPRGTRDPHVAGPQQYVPGSRRPSVASASHPSGKAYTANGNGRHS